MQKDFSLNSCPYYGADNQEKVCNAVESETKHSYIVVHEIFEPRKDWKFHLESGVVIFIDQYSYLEAGSCDFYIALDVYVESQSEGDAGEIESLGHWREILMYSRKVQ